MLYRLHVLTGSSMDARERPMGHRVVRPVGQQPVPGIKGGCTVADSCEGARQTILPIGTIGFQIRRHTVLLGGFIPSLQFGHEVGKRPPRLSISWVCGYGCLEACFGCGTSAGVPESIACNQGRFCDIGRDFEA
jgi:hypothetical protein